MLVYSSNHASVVLSLRQEGWETELIMKYLSYLDTRKRINDHGRSAFRDSEQSKVYSAEYQFIGKLRRAGKTNMKFEDYAEAEKYMKRILSSKTWEKLSKRKNVKLIEKRDMGGRSRTAGMSWGSTIQLCPRTGLNQYVLLHELAHSAGHMHHDVSFRQCLIKLVSRFMGAEAGQMLKDSFKEKGLKMYRHSTVMTPQQWKVFFDRAAKAREKLNAG